MSKHLKSKTPNQLLPVRISDDLHKKIKVEALGMGLTLQSYMEKLLEKRDQLNLLDLSNQKLKNRKTLQKNDNDFAFKFIDLFAGIGGMRIAFEDAGGKCVFTSEWDKFAQTTYRENFGETPHGDITKIEADRIPDHDLLVAGFPCQPFSIAGVSKKNSLGRSHGFKDQTQGTLFFDVARIIDKKRPKAFLLENVKNLFSHDKGNTFRIILGTLEELGYKVHYKVLDARYWVPQHRERIFIVGYDPKQCSSWNDFNFPILDNRNKKDLSVVLEKSAVDSKYTLSDKLWNYLQEYARKHREKGNGFGFGLFGPNDVARTLSARYYKDGSEILIKNGRKNPRRLTPRECARLMGYPEEFEIVVSDTQAYKQFGNSVCVPLVRDLALNIARILTTDNSKVTKNRKTRNPIDGITL
jgi:DNA (cytosine-5)-methyltransferase 1